MFFMRNYNRFLVGTKECPRWEDFYIHRNPRDYLKLLKFETTQEAEEFLEAHPQLQVDFDAWIMPCDPNDWKGDWRARHYGIDHHLLV